jgi:hypothetical protein
MLRFLPTATWAAGAVCLVLASATYARTIAKAESARAAAPLAAPFLLCAGGAAGFMACAGASAADTANRRRNIR